MANKNLFKSLIGALAPATDTINAHAAPAYAFDDRHALAQLAATGCLTDVCSMRMPRHSCRRC